MGIFSLTAEHLPSFLLSSIAIRLALPCKKSDAYTNTMRFASIAVAAFAAGAARADAVDDVKSAATDASSSVSSAVESATSSAVSKPTFTPTSLKAPFLEQFTDDWESRWKASSAKKQNDKKEDTEEWAYVGNWAVEEPSVLNGMVGDKGLIVKDKAAHHAISAKFDKPINPKGKPLVVQYEVKLQDGLECGGAYLKLLQENKKLHREEFSNASPYIIMFGPDKCGSTNKVHFIFRHKNPKTGEYEEKHLQTPPLAKIAKTSSLYQLAVFPNQTYSISIDGEQKKEGSLFEHFTPAVNPPKEIDDENDKKPEDWVDDARIADPEATKPEDWDEDAPYEIVDEEATKPEDWLDDEPLKIPDPEAEKPEDWDDDEDGDWQAPEIPNPKCQEASGCGKWEPPMKKNPAYKGKWKPRKIANPKYYEDKTPANFEPMGALGFELWATQDCQPQVLRGQDTSELRANGCSRVRALGHARLPTPSTTRTRHQRTSSQWVLSGSSSGPCRTTYSSTTSTLVTRLRMLMRSRRKPGISRSPPRRLKRRRTSQRLLSQSLTVSSASRRTQSSSSSKRSTSSSPLPRTIQSRPSSLFLRLLALSAFSLSRFWLSFSAPSVVHLHLQRSRMLRRRARRLLRTPLTRPLRLSRPVLRRFRLKSTSARLARALNRLERL